MKMDTRKVIWTKKEDELPAVEVVDAKAAKIMASAQRLFAEQTEMNRNLAREKN
jgi:hypothetical protein